MADNPLGSKKTFSFLVVGFAGLAAEHARDVVRDLGAEGEQVAGGAERGVVKAPDAHGTSRR